MAQGSMEQLPFHPMGRRIPWLLRKKAKKFHEIMWHLVSLHMKYRIEFRGVLTREQCNKLIELGGFR